MGGDANADIARIRACRQILQPGDVLVADANTGWTMHEAARVVAAVRDVDVYIEQPCPSYEECLSIRRRTGLPFVLDEVITGTDVLVRGLADHAMDVINLKISKVGGLTKARLMRDLCVASGIPMTIEDTWGGDIVTAAIAHLARSTPAEAVAYLKARHQGVVDRRRKRQQAAVMAVPAAVDQEETALQRQVRIATEVGSRALKAYRPSAFGGKITLVPSNAQLSPLVFDAAEVTVFGKVVTVMRRLT
mgnify:CR=1 FL=1